MDKGEDASWCGDAMTVGVDSVKRANVWAEGRVLTSSHVDGKSGFSVKN